MGAIAEYRKKEADYLLCVADLGQMTIEHNMARKHLKDLCRLCLEKFIEGFSQITLELKKMSEMITSAATRSSSLWTPSIRYWRGSCSRC